MSTNDTKELVSMSQPPVAPVAPVASAIAHIRAEVAAAAQRVGRDPDDVHLIAVTKTHPAALVRAAHAAGVVHMGENRVQEAGSKLAALHDLRPALTWHLIGHLQRNKARQAVSLFDMVHSLDSLRLAETLNRYVRDNPRWQGQPMPVLLQLNVSGEATKEGFPIVSDSHNDTAWELFCADVAAVLALPHLAVQGLMTIAPYSDDPAASRPFFVRLRRVQEALAARFPTGDWRHLSMGMTNDYPVAVEEGATFVRVGRAIFGERERA